MRFSQARPAPAIDAATGRCLGCRQMICECNPDSLRDAKLLPKALKPSDMPYLLRPTLVYKPMDFNPDWSSRFSMLRDKNGWNRAKTA